MLELQKVSLELEGDKGVEILKNINITFYDKKIYVVTGPNGGGKSSLAKIIMGVTANIDIVTKKDKSGIDVIVKPYTKGESVHIPVIVTEENINDVVYNTFEIGEYSDVVIIAGCGIHNCGDHKSQHDGIHTFFVRKGAKLKYVEKHYGQGEGKGQRVLNPKTILSTPRISAYHSEAQLVHEAAIGRIESEQLIKLMSMGFSEKEAEDTILNGFLK